MTNTETEKNSWMSWATGKFAMLAIGIGAGYFLYSSGLLQKVTSKILKKKEEE